MALKRKLVTLLKKFFPVSYVKYRYKTLFGKKLNLKNPQNFNEKILWLMLYWQHPLVVTCADKYRMRDYVKKCGCIEYMPKLYGVYKNTNEIEWDKFPEKFAIKCNHGCKMNIICSDKSNFNIQESERKLNYWMHDNYAYHVYEPHYAHIKPLILCEEYIKTEAGVFPDDYKIYCFNGKAKVVLVCMERQGSKLRLEWYDLDWNPLDIGRDKNEQKAKKPSCLDEMIKCAEKLANPFPYVRVDFYDKDGKAVLGEMTFTPYYGMARYYNETGNAWLGSLLKLPEKYPRHYK